MAAADWPFVSAVCVTGKSAWHLRHMLPQALRAFAEQAYPSDRAELVVVTDRDLTIDEAPRVRVVRAEPGQALGALRNLGLDAARGDYCAQFDDDDHHAPGRLALQVRACLSRPGLPSYLKRQLCYDWTTDTAFVRELDGTFIHGTICHPRTAARYPAIAREEDSAFVSAWPQQVAVDNDPELYVRFFHGGNTWDRGHVLRGYAGAWARGRWHLCDGHREALERVLARYPGLRRV